MRARSDQEAEGAGLLSNSDGERGDGHAILSGLLGARSSRLRRAVRHCIQHEPLLLATLLGVGVGVVLGTALSFAHLSPLALEVVGLPGELLMRTLKMLVLPLITASVMSGVCALRQSTADMGKVARYTLLYYLTTTLGAVVLGIVIVNIVRPGRGSPFDQLDPSGEGGGGGGSSCHAANQQKVASHAASTGQHSPLEAFLGVIKSAFPDNVFLAAVNMNVLGIITVSLLMGAALSALGPEAAPMVSLISVFNDAVGKIVNWVIWTSPVGIASLITTSICRACNLGATLAALGLFILAVLLGLLLWGFIVLPLIYYATTRRDPRLVYRGFSQAMATAFGTDSSNATLPITMRSAVQMGCDPRVVQFFLPLGTTVNMNGTALYEAVTVIFIAQAHGVVLGAAGTVIVALTATLAAVGAAGIPSAGLVTMLMVLQAVDLEQYAGDIAIILAVDWFLDRCRTVVNVLGDSFGTVIIDHHARKWTLGEGPGGAINKHQGDGDGATDGNRDNGRREGGHPAVGSSSVELVPPQPPQSPPSQPAMDLTVTTTATASHQHPCAHSYPTPGQLESVWGKPQEYGEVPRSQHYNHHDHHHNHHDNHLNRQLAGGLFHPQRGDPENVRQGLLPCCDGSSDAFDDCSLSRASGGGVDEAMTSATAEASKAQGFAAVFLRGSAPGLTADGPSTASYDVVACFGFRSGSTQGFGMGSGSGSRSVGHVGGGELHHHHPYALPQEQGLEAGQGLNMGPGVGGSRTGRGGF